MSTTHTRRCNACGQLHTMLLNTDGDKLEKFIMTPRSERPFVQVHFPELNADEREFLISGVTPDEFNELFGDDEG